jgi:hypothetical protein
MSNKWALPASKVLAHALLIDVREDGSLDILIVPQVALDRLTKKLGARESGSLLKFTGELLRGSDERSSMVLSAPET